MSITRRRSAPAVDGAAARSWRRLGRASLIVAAGSAALALAGPMALRPILDATEAAGAAGDVTVAFVLDFGTGATAVVGCVRVPASDNRYDALAAFVKQAGMALPSYDPNGSGLLCSINAVPTTGCGQIVQGGYIYWSYFTGGSNGWTYASSGAFGGVTNGDVEGWRFQDPGTGRPGDPPPRFPSQHDPICAAGAVTTTTATTTTTSTTTTTLAGSNPGRPGSTAAPATDGSNVNGRSSTTIATPTSAPSPTSTTTTTGTTSSAPAPASAAVSVPSTPVAALSTAGHPARASGPGTGPLIIGGLLVTALGIAAFARWRRRPRTP